MKQKIANPNKGLKPAAQEKACDHATSKSAEEIAALNIYLLAYSYPFIPAMDLTVAFDELRKMMKNWFLNKRERAIIYKKKTHETI